MKRFVSFLSLATILISLAGALMFSEAHADRAVKIFESLKHTKGEYYGKSFVLLPWEKKIIREVYGTLKEDGTRQYKFVYVEIPKKNGKSELGAGAAIFSLYADGEMAGEVYSCASDRSQAAIIFNVAKDMVEQDQFLLDRSKITGSETGSTKAIVDKKTKSLYKVLSAEAYSKHGYNISCCVFDELHAQPNRKLWDVMTHYAGDARAQPIWWILTTAGDDPDRVSIGWEVHDYAMKVLEDPSYDPTWYVVRFGYDGEDIYNEVHWYEANPGLGHNLKIEDFREAALKAKNNPADERLFRWLKLNQWITTKLTSWLPLDLWDATIGKWKQEDQLGKYCYLGIDLSTTTDLSAVCYLFPPQGTQTDWRAMWKAFIPAENMRERINTDHIDYDKWVSAGHIIATEGNVIDYTVIKDEILEAKGKYKVIELAADRSFATMLIQELEKEGMICVDIPQHYSVLTDPMNTIETLLKSGNLTHEENKCARWCFGNTSISKNGNAQIKYVKEHKGKSVDRTKRIDTTAALVIAMARAKNYQPVVDLSEAVKKGSFGF